MSVSPILVLFLGILAASTSSVLIRFAQSDAPSIVIAAYRLGVAALILLPITLIRSADRRVLRTRSIYLPGILAGLFLAIHFGTWITSLEYTSVTSSVALVQTTPLFVILFSPFLLREYPNRYVTTGLIVALIGIFTIALGDLCIRGGDISCPPVLEVLNQKSLRGDLLALAGAASGAMYLIIGRRVRQDIPLIPYLFLVYAFAAGFLILMSISTGQRVIGFQPTTYLLFLLLAIFPQLFAHSIYNWALKFLSATSVSISLLAEPVAATILAMLLLDEVPSLVRIIGAVLVLIGIAIALLRSDERG